MLTEDAIKHLQADTQAMEAHSSLREIVLNEHHADGIILHKDYKTESVEKFFQTPLFFRAEMQTTSLTDWLSYVNKNARQGTGIFIDKENMTANAIIDLGSHDKPEWGRHTATLQMLKTPEYSALLNHANKNILQKDFIDLLQDWADTLSFQATQENEDEPVETLEFKKGLQRFRRLNLEEISKLQQDHQNTSAAVQANTAYSIKSAQQNPINFITMTSPCYVEMPLTEIKIAVRYDKSDKGLIIYYRIIAAQQLEENIAQKFKEIISNGINNTEIVPIIGIINYQ